MENIPPIHETHRVLPGRFAFIILLGIIILFVGLVIINQIGSKTMIPQTHTVVSLPISDIPQLVDDSGMKTYTDARLGMSFQYPSQLQVSADSNDPSVFILDLIENGTSLPVLTLNIYENPDDLSLEAFEKNRKYSNCSVYDPNDQELEIAKGIQAYYRKEGFCEPVEVRMYIWQHKHKIFQLRSRDSEQSKDIRLDNVFSTLTLF